MCLHSGERRGRVAASPSRVASERLPLGLRRPVRRGRKCPPPKRSKPLPRAAGTRQGNMRKPDTFLLPPNGEIPNNRRLPVVLYRKLLNKFLPKKAEHFERVFRANGWRGTWHDSIYPYCHFHSNAHEVLGIARGTVAVELGGAGGRVLRLTAGDLVLLPAGVGHRRVRGSPNLIVVGAYPAGQQKYNICTSLSECRDAKKRIATVALPEHDPFFGPSGPLKRLWRKK